MSDLQQVKSSEPKELTQSNNEDIQVHGGAHPVTCILRVFKVDIRDMHTKGVPIAFKYRWRYDTLLAHCIKHARETSYSYELPISKYKIRELKVLGKRVHNFTVLDNFIDIRYNHVYELCFNFS